MPRQNTAPADFPLAVLQQIAQLGQHIAIARKRRGESQAQWAKKLGVSQPTMARIERGDPAVSMAFYVMCIWLINPAQGQGLAELIAPQHDHAALELEVAKVRTKRRPVGPKAVPATPLHTGAPSAPAHLSSAAPQVAEPTLNYGALRKAVAQASQADTAQTMLQTAPHSVGQQVQPARPGSILAAAQAAALLVRAKPGSEKDPL
ncbi:helix-turn-helix transcriptional regulator [Comamonas sp. GB3 AK4-5]|uniref:helix-turn-helix transcriptional regulator n=1 Tax=Comamonas sp. GB3 AK4-5 TaxID=3231487 RepID=UPI00351E13B6